jgi:Arc/MetJ-type ribon-helix-helix transcriptional regulator
MSVIQFHMPDQVKDAIDRQVAGGRVASEADFLVEAARRYAEDLEIEPVVVAEAKAGIVDAEAGRHVTISGPEDAEAWHQRAMRRLAGSPEAAPLPLRLRRR